MAVKTGYDQFFAKARQAAAQQPAPARAKSSAPRTAKPMMQPKKRPKAEFPLKMVIFSTLGLGLAVWGYLHYEDVEKFVHRLELSWGGYAYAQEGATSSPAKAPASVSSATNTSGAASAKVTQADLEHLAKLNQRKAELDAREAELARVESELNLQKAELEKRMQELEEMRAKISNVLDEKVKGDAEKVDALVQMYTNMKPPQAAKIFETMDEDLAVEILGKMKKKNAADVMNLLPPEKAQNLTEKFAGYKRR